MLSRIGRRASEGAVRQGRVRALGGLVLLLAACAPADEPPNTQTSNGAPYEAVDDAGRVVSLSAPARRIISLIPATTETVMAIGGAESLIARTDYDDGGLAHLPSVGGGLTPSIELLASLQPDLVIAWEEAGAARVRSRLEALGIPVFAAQTRDTADIYANIQRFGRLMGLRSRADSLAASIRRDLESVASSVADRRSPRVVYMIGLDPPMIAGPSVFIGEVLGVAGGENVFADIRAPSPQMSLEEILARAPDIVLIPASGVAATPLERLQKEPGWRELMASGKTRFEALPPNILHRPGPSIVRSAWVLRNALFPDLPIPE